MKTLTQMILIDVRISSIRQMTYLNGFVRKKKLPLLQQ
jgi:hypothetical protein